MTATRINPARGCTVTNTYRSSDLTTTGTTNIASVTHTSTTGKVVVFGSAVIKTTGKTAAIVLFSGSDELAPGTTSNTAETRATALATHDATVGVATTYNMKLRAQDSSVTATMPSYETYTLAVMDV